MTDVQPSDVGEGSIDPDAVPAWLEYFVRLHPSIDPVPERLTPADLKRIEHLWIDEIEDPYTRADYHFPDVERCVNLRKLILVQHQFAEGVDWDSLAKLPKLEYLRIQAQAGGASDKDLAHIGALAGIRRLTVQASTVSAAGLAHLAGLPRLEYLALEHGTVSDVGFAGFGGLGSLRELHVKDCQGFTGAALAGLSGLRVLTLRSTGVPDAGLANVTAMKDLRQLHLHNCTKVTDAAMAYIVKCDRLEELGLGYTSITDRGLMSVSRLPGLRVLKVYGCRGVTDAGMVHIGQISTLEELDLGGTSVTDAGMAHLLGLTALRGFHHVGFPEGQNANWLRLSERARANTERLWRPIIAEWRSSGLSVQEFCSKHSLSLREFVRWQRRLWKGGE